MLFNVGTKLSKAKWLLESLLAFEMNKTKVKINKPVCLGLSVLKTKYVYADLVEVVEKRSDTSNYEVDRPLLVS